MKNKNRCIPSLDGLRAVSIAFVIVSHIFRERALHGSRATKAFLLLVGNGKLGVDIFFGISGFLITTLLVAEYARSAKIDLMNFYVRRSFRIFPAFYCYLLAILILNIIGVVETRPRTWISAATYLRNYWPPFENSGDYVTAHAWSLAVEEQFYLFWPLCFALFGRRRAVWVAAVLIALSPVSRLLSYAFLPELRTDLGYMTHTRGDALMVGCIAALLIENAVFRRLMNRAFAWRLHLLAIPLLLFGSPLLSRQFGGTYQLPVGFSLEAFAIILILLWLVERPATPIGRLLNTQFVVHIGIISYSLYLWQQLFTFGLVPPIWSVPATVLAAEASFWLVERPFLRIRDRVLRLRLLARTQRSL